MEVQVKNISIESDLYGRKSKENWEESKGCTKVVIQGREEKVMTVIMMKTLWDLWLIEGIYDIFIFFYYRRWLFNLITAWIALWLAREMFKGRMNND